MSVIGWLQRGMERARAERDSWPQWLRRNSKETNDMADNECDCDEDGIDNGDGIDQCIVWPCDEVRDEPSLHCTAHREFAHVDQEETDGI